MITVEFEKRRTVIKYIVIGIALKVLLLLFLIGKRGEVRRKRVLDSQDWKNKQLKTYLCLHKDISNIERDFAIKFIFLLSKKSAATFEKCLQP